MSLLVPNEGETRLLNELLDGALAREDWTLKLFQSNTTPAETDTSATYTVANFTNYVDKTLTRTVSGTTWSTPASGAPTGAWSAEAAVAESAYGSAAQSWTCGTTGNTIFGYYLVGVTSTKLIGAERFASSRTLVSGDSLSLTPRFGLA